MAAVRPVNVPFDRPIRLGVLISGGGTTFANLQGEIAAGRLHACIPLVIASRGDCGGSGKARAAGIPCETVVRGDFDDLASFSAATFDPLREARVDLVILAGYLALLEIPEDFRHRVMNIHPALLPAFGGRGYYGRRVHEAVLARGARVSGCTVHFADNEYDEGPIIVQKCVPVASDDTPDRLAARVFAAECIAYPEAIRLFAAGRLEIEGRLVRVLAPGERSA